MWTKDLISELIQAVKDLPPQIVDNLDKHGGSKGPSGQPRDPGMTRTGGRNLPPGFHTSGGTLPPTLYHLEMLLRSFGRWLPGMSQFAAGMQAFRRSADILARATGSGGQLGPFRISAQLPSVPQRSSALQQPSIVRMTRPLPDIVARTTRGQGWMPPEGAGLMAGYATGHAGLMEKVISRGEAISERPRQVRAPRPKRAPRKQPPPISEQAAHEADLRRTLREEPELRAKQPATEVANVLRKSLKSKIPAPGPELQNATVEDVLHKASLKKVRDAWIKAGAIPDINKQNREWRKLVRESLKSEPESLSSMRFGEVFALLTPKQKQALGGALPSWVSETKMSGILNWQKTASWRKKLVDAGLMTDIGAVRQTIAGQISALGAGSGYKVGAYGSLGQRLAGYVPPPPTARFAAPYATFPAAYGSNMLGHPQAGRLQAATGIVPPVMPSVSGVTSSSLVSRMTGRAAAASAYRVVASSSAPMATAAGGWGTRIFGTTIAAAAGGAMTSPAIMGVAAVALVAAAAAAAAYALYKIPKAVEAMGNRRIGEIRKYEFASGPLAAAFMQTDYADWIRNVKIGQGISESSITLLRRQDQLREAMVPRKIAFGNLRNKLSASWTSIATGMEEHLTSSGLWKDVNNLADRLGNDEEGMKRLGRALSGAGEDFLGTLKYAVLPSSFITDLIQGKVGTGGIGGFIKGWNEKAPPPGASISTMPWDDLLRESALPKRLRPSVDPPDWLYGVP